ncbi:D-arabinose 1-dehydrogenase [Pleurostoma richardsiae]|uniref:D-arabinose 1-dehydrogenase n=1 Tax=Pleurostoma richardsiae TaxID=41990 RepID=A0AA38RIP1_9PEZI|nr:D-arabinose 1-dehydrogenase [Pleurostoma richardsiae]
MAAPNEQPADPAPARSLSAVLPPLVLGTATFNTQYVADPSSMPYAAIVARALDLGIAAFDTSPYYGPSELLLGDALRSINPSRESLFLVSKAGRVGPTEFDYSPSWIRYSVLRSLKRLGTTHLDLVYTHDAEFVPPADVLGAVSELRRLRDEGLVRYVGISGYPVDQLCQLAELVLRKTGEPLDAVMSYCHCSIQNGVLVKGFDQETGGVSSRDAPATAAYPLSRFREAGVSVVLNASMLGMGLLTTRGVDNGPQAAWHPSPPLLRKACASAAAAATRAGKKLESIAIRYALDTFARAGAEAGLGVQLPGVSMTVGPSVIGVSSIDELEETWRVWQSVLHGLSLGREKPRDGWPQHGDRGSEKNGPHALSLEQRDEVRKLVRETIWPLLGEWRDYSWMSPEEGFVNSRQQMGVMPADSDVMAEYETLKEKQARSLS